MSLWYTYKVGVSMKRVLIGTSIFLFIVIISLSFVLYRRYQDNKIINQEIKEDREEKNKKREEKQRELDNLIEQNKDKIERYQKIEKWNEEITSYLE
jgi:predicted Holliday junction resolvase-like endonuclease